MKTYKTNLEQYKELMGFNNDLNTRVISEIDEILSQSDEITPEEIFSAYCWIGNDFNFKYFKYINKKYKLSVEAFSEAVKNSYTCGRMLRNSFRYFNNKKYNWLSVASDEEKEIYKSLPDRVTIYRGTNIAEATAAKRDMNFSWTLDRVVAEFFAFRFGSVLPPRVVIETEISKDEIKAIFNDRKEKEVICICPKQDIKITTRRKTSYYEQYTP